MWIFINGCIFGIGCASLILVGALQYFGSGIRVETGDETHRYHQKDEAKI